MSSQDIATAGNVLSLIGCGVIIASYVVGQRRRKQAGQSGGMAAGSGHADVHHRSMLFMALTNVLLNVGGLTYNSLDYAGERAICVLQALHITYFNLSNWLWTVCIASNILLILRRKDFYPRHLSAAFCAVCWLVPGALVLPVLADRERNIANVGPWCWIPAAKPGLRYGVFYGWLLLTYFANLGILVAILVTAYRQRAEWRSAGANRPGGSDGRQQQEGKPAPAPAQQQQQHLQAVVVRTAPLSGGARSPSVGARSPSVGARSPSVCSRTAGSDAGPAHARGRKDPFSTLVSRYISYVFVVLFCWIFGVALRFAQVANPAFINQTLAALHTFFSISQMFWLSAVLVVSSELQRFTDRYFAARAAAAGRRRQRRPSTEPLNEGRRASAPSLKDDLAKPANAASAGTSLTAAQPKTIKKMVSTREFQRQREPKDFLPLPSRLHDGGGDALENV